MKLSELVMLSESEARLKFVLDRYRDKIIKVINRHDNGDTNQNPELDNTMAETLVKELYNADPSGGKIYTEWFVKQYLKDPRTLEDVTVISQDLVTFDLVKGRLPSDTRDINKMDRRQLQALVEPYQREEMEKSKRQRDKELEAKIKNDITIVYDGPEGSVKIPATQEASCYLGRGTRWCTAATNNNMFKYYAHSPLFVFTFKDGKKWQLHLSGEDGMQLMDEQDHGIRLNHFLQESLANKAIPLLLKYLKTVEEKVSYYCYLHPARNTEVEHWLLKYLGEYDILDQAIAYARHVMHGNWPDMDNVVIKSTEGYYVFRWYEMIKDGKRWPGLEHEFAKDFQFNEGQFFDRMLEYNKKHMGSKRWPELEAAFERELRSPKAHQRSWQSLAEYIDQVSNVYKETIFELSELKFVK